VQLLGEYKRPEAQKKLKTQKVPLKELGIWEYLNSGVGIRGGINLSNNLDDVQKFGNWFEQKLKELKLESEFTESYVVLTEWSKLKEGQAEKEARVKLKADANVKLKAEADAKTRRDESENAKVRAIEIAKMKEKEVQMLQQFQCCYQLFNL